MFDEFVVSEKPLSPYVGLSPFLRLSIAGEPLQPVAEHLLSVAADEPDNPNVWMNLSLAAQCLGQPETGAAMRDQALALARCYALPALRQPASCRLLLLMAEGDIAENTPIDCLLEQSDVDLVHFYPRDGHLNFADLPEHDILMVAMADSPASRPLLAGLAGALADWPRPVINRPEHVPATERAEASRRLQEVPGIRMPPTRLVGRDALSRIAAGQSAPAMEFPDVGFPFIVRPRGSQAGRDLARVESAPELAGYLSAVDALEFFISDYVDYRGVDGLFRKMRIALIDGEPFVCHMAVSGHWMVHYVNAGMYEDAGRRAEEAAFMARFDAFAERHRVALAALCQRIPLDYFCIDCAELPDGRLMIFEVDHVMVVHAMDPEALFPYKQQSMQRVEEAFRAALLRRLGRSSAEAQ